MVTSKPKRISVQAAGVVHIIFLLKERLINIDLAEQIGQVHCQLCNGQRVISHVFLYIYYNFIEAKY
jgi:hypothetical protein